MSEMAEHTSLLSCAFQKERSVLMALVSEPETQDIQGLPCPSATSPRPRKGRALHGREEMGKHILDASHHFLLVL